MYLASKRLLALIQGKRGRGDSLQIFV